MAATKQMHALQAVLHDIHAAATIAQGAVRDVKTQLPDENAKSVAAEAGPWAAKNTIVRDVLSELTNAAQKYRKTRLQGVYHTTVEQRGSPVRQKK